MNETVVGGFAAIAGRDEVSTYIVMVWFVLYTGHLWGPTLDRVLLRGGR